ncbi:MAG TPA: TraY domain-containing protein [Allosphingosinicella sp.]|nr:TraY domain-containing protein [Allosphingosinicella sp.]
MLAVRLDSETERRLAELAARTGRSKSFYARAAIERHLEDLEDHFLAEEAMRTYDPSENITLAELKRLYGLDDRGFEGGEKAA